MSSPVVASFVTVTIILTVIVCTSKTVDSSKILVLPIVGKSHVFSMVAIADSLAARGHSVTVVVDQKFPLDEPEVETGRRRGIHYERTVDLIDDYDAWYENWTRKMLDDELNMKGMRSMAAAM
jgi:hypothetical protein